MTNNFEGQEVDDVIITPAMLQVFRPCVSQYRIFCSEWPDGAPITLDTLRRARELRLNIDWFASKFLSDPVWAEYEKARAVALAKYEKVYDAAWAEYEKVCTPALAKYKKARAAALDEYKKVRAVALDEYEKTRAAALAEYKKV